MSPLADLRTKPWWTDADRAEFDVHVHELVEYAFKHREADCAACAAGYPPCPHVGAAIQNVVDWRDDRILRSRALWLRAQQDRLDEITRAEILWDEIGGAA